MPHQQAGVRIDFRRASESDRAESAMSRCAPLFVQRIDRFFAQRKLTTSLTADSAILLLIGMPGR